MDVGLLSRIERQPQFAAEKSQWLPLQFGHPHAPPTLAGLPQGREDQFQAGPLGVERHLASIPADPPGAQDALAAAPPASPAGCSPVRLCHSAVDPVAGGFDRLSEGEGNGR